MLNLGMRACGVFANWISLAFSWHPTEYVSPSPLLKMETDPLSETCILVFRIPDDGESPETQYSEQYNGNVLNDFEFQLCI
jgi:hypothetical protein